MNRRSSLENVFNRKYFFFKTVSPDALLDTSISSQSELRGAFALSNLVESLEFGFAGRILGKQLSGKGRRGNWDFKLYM